MNTPKLEDKVTVEKIRKVLEKADEEGRTHMGIALALVKEGLTFQR